MSELSLHMAVKVAARVLGLTSSPPGLARRLEALFRTSGPDLHGDRVLTRLRTKARALAPLLFYSLDVLRRSSCAVGDRVRT